MRDRLKIAFWGMGSIAKRHIRNLSKLLLSKDIDYQIDVYRHIKSKDIDDGMQEYIHVVYEMNDLQKQTTMYDIAFITNPTSMHYDALKLLVPYSKNIFIEKPVFYKSDVDIDELELRAKSNYYVACPLRYTAVLQYICKNVDLSAVFSVRAISSSYLPDWRPGQDYAKTYSAHRDMGGGVNIDLIHEWDYLTWMFGVPQSVSYVGGKFSNLDIDSDDLATYIGTYDDKVIELHLDYFGRKTVRELVLYTPEETIKADLSNSRVEYMKSGKVIDFQEDRDTYQMRELGHFLDIVEGKTENDSTIEHGIEVLKLARGVV